MKQGKVTWLFNVLCSVKLFKPLVYPAQRILTGTLTLDHHLLCSNVPMFDACDLSASILAMVQARHVDVHTGRDLIVLILYDVVTATLKCAAAFSSL